MLFARAAHVPGDWGGCLNSAPKAPGSARAHLLDGALTQGETGYDGAFFGGKGINSVLTTVE